MSYQRGSRPNCHFGVFTIFTINSEKNKPMLYKYIVTAEIAQKAPVAENETESL